jgi:DNA-binding MarR family transcriptional regulator
MSTASQRVVGTHQALSDRPEIAIPYLLKSLHHTLRQAVDEALRAQRVELSFAHMATLYGLETEPGLTGAELSRRLFVTPQTMNTLLHSLELDKDIERQPHPSNQRAERWYLTKSGSTRLGKAKHAGEAVWARLLAALNPREVEQFKGFLQRCIEGFDLPRETQRQGAARKRSAAVVKAPRRTASSSR